MKNFKFLIFGQNTKVLGRIKNTLASNGYIFSGFTKDYTNMLRHIRNKYPDFVIIEVTNNFREIRAALEMIEEEVIVPCVLILENKTDEVYGFLLNTKIMAYITKPLFDESLLQIVEMTLLNYSRISEYEKKVNKLSDMLESRKVIEKAKWILVQKEGYSEEEAYEIIKKKSRDNRMRMRDIAQAVILTKG